MGITLDGQVFVNGTYHGGGINMTQQPPATAVNGGPPAVSIILAGVILVLCFLVPCLCRSRLTTMRVSEQQQHQQDTNATSNDVTDEEKEKQAEALINRHLKTHSMKLTADNFITRDNPRHIVSLDDSLQGSVAGEIVLSSPSLPTIGGASKDLTSSTSPNQRTVPNACAICISHYKERDRVVWSSNKECIHVFHKACINAWLMKNRRKELACPCCRQEFITTTTDDDITTKMSKDEHEDESTNNMDVEMGRTVERAVSPVPNEDVDV